MRVFISTLLLTVCLLCTTTTALDFEITKVIEVGPAAWVPFTGPLRWSPDGTKLAYFAHNYLMISDTLGNSQEVMKIDSGITPHRFEWVSNDKIAINMPQRRKSDSTLIKTITMIDIATGEDEIVAMESLKRGRKFGTSRKGDVYLDGPYLTIEGNAYYQLQTNTGRSVKWERGRRSETIDEPHWFLPDKAPPMKDNHVIRWHPDGLYEISLEGNDSTRLGPTPFSSAGPFSAISSDRAYAMNGGVIMRVADSTCIVLDTIPLGEIREGALICGFSYVSFNPKFSEVLFELTGDDGEKVLFAKIGVFDYVGSEFSILDVFGDGRDCTFPICSPDGRKIAFITDYTAYIIYREMK